MALLIKGMDMPNGCHDCLIPCDKMVYEQSRPNDCPLVEIPTPHGRLIDESKIDFSRPKTFGEIVAEISNLPTIVEAEE